MQDNIQVPPGLAASYQRNGKSTNSSSNDTNNSNKSAAVATINPATATTNGNPSVPIASLGQVPPTEKTVKDAAVPSTNSAFVSTDQNTNTGLSPPLITTLLLSVANQQPGLVPQVNAPSAETGANTNNSSLPNLAPASSAPNSAQPPSPNLAQAQLQQMQNFLAFQQMAAMAQQQQQALQLQQQQQRSSPATNMMQLPPTANANNPLNVMNVPFAAAAAFQQQQLNNLYPHFLNAPPGKLPLPPLPGTAPEPEENTDTVKEIQMPPETYRVKVVPMYLDYDSVLLTEYQCLMRQQIELFEASPIDVRGSAQGRHSRIQLGQVGIRCKHCASLPKPARARGAIYFSKTINGMYQVAQNMSKVHLCKCHQVPDPIKGRLIKLQKGLRRASGGKEYWAEALRTMGVMEMGGILRFKESLILAEQGQTEMNAAKNSQLDSDKSNPSLDTAVTSEPQTDSQKVKKQAIV